MKIYVVGSSKNNFLQLNDIREKFLVDVPHDGKNIDFLNPWYCELTGLYYLWKHCTDDIVGLEHYRRYFVNDDNKLLSDQEIKEILSEYDVLCRRWVFAEHKQKNPLSFWSRKENKDKYAVFEYFLNNCIDRDLRDFFYHKMETATEFCQCNMFIGKKEIIDEYCDWLFNSLCNINNTNKFINVPRVIGYVSEFLFGFWLEYNNVKIKYNTSIEINKDTLKIVEIFK